MVWYLVNGSTHFGFYSRYNSNLIMRRKCVGHIQSIAPFWTKSYKQARAVQKRLPKGALIEVISVCGWPRRNCVLREVE